MELLQAIAGGLILTFWVWLFTRPRDDSAADLDTSERIPGDW